MSIRLQKFIAQAGISSRRKAETLIMQGRIAVNGVTVTRLGTTVDPDSDKISFDGQDVICSQPHVTYILHKPAGLICSASAKQGRTIFSLFPSTSELRLFSVGRLDKYSEGLLLVTNSGKLAHELAHPRYRHTKTYDVTVRGKVSKDQLHHLQAPMIIEGYQTLGAQVQIIQQQAHPATTKLRIILQEGRSRQIRHMCAQQNLAIQKLKRIKIGQLSLGHLKPGAYRILKKEELLLTQKNDSLPATPSNVCVHPTAAKVSTLHRPYDLADLRVRPKSHGRHPNAHAKSVTLPGRVERSGGRDQGK